MSYVVLEDSNFNVNEKVNILFKSAMGFPSTLETKPWFLETEIKYNNYINGEDVFLDEITESPNFSVSLNPSDVGLTANNFATGGEIKEDDTGTIRYYKRLKLTAVPGSSNNAYYLTDSSGNNVLSDGLQFNTKWSGSGTKPYGYQLSSLSQITANETAPDIILRNSSGGNWFYDIKNGAIFFPDYSSSIVDNTTNPPVFSFYKYVGRKGISKLIMYSTPSNPRENQLYIDTTNNILQRYDGEDWVNIGSSGSFTGLTGTPSSFTNEGGKFLKVNSSSNAVEFASFALSDIPNGTDPGQVIKWSGTEWTLGTDNTGSGGGGGSGGSSTGTLGVYNATGDAKVMIETDGSNASDVAKLVLQKGSAVANLSWNGTSLIVDRPLLLGSSIDNAINSDVLLAGSGNNFEIRKSTVSISNLLTTSSELSDLNDVSNTNPIDGQVLTWNETSSIWEPATASGGGSIASTDLSDATTFTAPKATILETARTIGGVAFDGSANIDLPGVNTTGNQNTTGNAATATTLETARTIGGVSFDGSANIDLPGVNTTGNQNTTGNAATATKLSASKTIGGVSFDGSANIDLPGVNTNGNQNTTGNAATATKLAASKTIAGQSFDGSANIEIALSNLSNVADTDPSSNQVLTWNETNSSWEPADASGGGSSVWSTSGSDIYRSSGGVGIGTSSPGYPLHIYGSTSANAGSVGYLNSSGASSTGNANNDPVGLKVENAIWTGNIVMASSDSRIKENIVDVPDNIALEQLRNIPCRHYEYRDKLSRGSDKTIGFIAQEVNSVLPMAVSTQKGIIPSVYKVILCEWTGSVMYSQELGSVSGVKYKFYVSNTNDDEVEKIVTGSSDNTFTFEQQWTNVFCYGREVDDFHTVDKNKLFALNFSATQELDRQQQADKAKIQTLETKVQTLETTLISQQTLIQSLLTRLEALENP